MADSEGESLGAETALTKEQQERVDQAFVLDRQLREALRLVHGGWWASAKVAHEMHQERAWELLGYSRIEEYLGQPEIGIPRSSFFKRSQAWRDFVGVKQIDVDELQKIDPSKVLETRPALMSGDVSVEQAISDAESLSYRDVVEKYRPSKREQHGQDPNGSKLAAEDEPQRVRCPCCRQWTTLAEIPEKWRQEA